MPIVSVFYGIIIRMYFKEHNPPHFHAMYQGFEASVDLDGNVLKGELPKAQMRMVLAWLEIHHDDLMANWELAAKDGIVLRVKPLK